MGAGSPWGIVHGGLRCRRRLRLIHDQRPRPEQLHLVGVEPLGLPPVQASQRIRQACFQPLALAALGQGAVLPLGGGRVERLHAPELRGHGLPQRVELVTGDRRCLTHPVGLACPIQRKQGVASGLTPV